MRRSKLEIMNIENLNLECSRIVLFVQDLRAVGTFYREVLGLPPKITPDEPDKWLEFQAGAVSIALHDHGMPNKTKRPPKITFYARDVAATRETLLARGAKLSKIIKTEDFEFFNGVDPENNHFSVSSRL
jgi:predicted enzyme related to lactoylglutathione lyase